MQWSARVDRVLLAGTGVLVGANGLLVALAPSRTRSAYGIAVTDVNLTILLRHRAVLLLLVGAGLVTAAFRAQVRGPAMCAAAVSMAAFVLFTFGADGANAAQRRVALLDVVLLGVLGLAAALTRQGGVRRRGKSAP